MSARKNWRLWVVIPALREAAGELQTSRLRPAERQRWRPHPNPDRAVIERRYYRLLWAFQELMKQRARLRRNRGKQMTFDYQGATTDDAVEMNPRHSSESVEHGTPPAVVEAVYSTMGAIDLDPASCEKANAYIEAVEFFAREDDGFRMPWHGRVFLNPPGGLCEAATARPVYNRTKKREACSYTGACGLPPVAPSERHKHENTTSSAAAWWRKLVGEYVTGRVEQAIFIGFTLEILQTTQVDNAGPVPLDFPICYPRKRLDYIALERDGVVPGGAPTHASFVCFLPPYGVTAQVDPKCRHAAVVRFREAFKGFGRVVCP